jgi:hypothetical protein
MNNPVADIQEAWQKHLQSGRDFNESLLVLPQILSHLAAITAHLESSLMHPAELANGGWQAYAKGLVAKSRQWCKATQYGPSAWREEAR